MTVIFAKVTAAAWEEKKFVFPSQACVQLAAKAVEDQQSSR